MARKIDSTEHLIGIDREPLASNSGQQQNEPSVLAIKYPKL
jgi:hypothetical protein